MKASCWEAKTAHSKSSSVEKQENLPKGSSLFRIPFASRGSGGTLGEHVGALELYMKESVSVVCKLANSNKATEDILRESAEISIIPDASCGMSKAAYSDPTLSNYKR